MGPLGAEEVWAGRKWKNWWIGGKDEGLEWEGKMGRVGLERRKQEGIGGTGNVEIVEREAVRRICGSGTGQKWGEMVDWGKKKD
ncbi:hypothetical protein Pmani_025555 [Petrolisthes manimaculis]|uniref:Uncharacterized protein n=1 Tax=Petrolisthes manimaculis TaxID=1843537 RepID=A0AAE1P7W5_9EUCA|nr:hypothetical protein Pmani_025555 [Petrolisthes manimaculis]